MVASRYLPESIHEAVLGSPRSAFPKGKITMPRRSLQQLAIRHSALNIVLRDKVPFPEASLVSNLASIKSPSVSSSN
jgi:hypothetical protein